jgi:hypothetical protein
MNKKYNLIRYEISTKFKEYNELFIDKLLYELDVEGLLFKPVSYGGWSLYLVEDILHQLNNKMELEITKSKKRLLFVLMTNDNNGLLNDNDVISLIRDKLI